MVPRPAQGPHSAPALWEVLGESGSLPEDRTRPCPAQVLVLAAGQPAQRWRLCPQRPSLAAPREAAPADASSACPRKGRLPGPGNSAHRPAPLRHLLTETAGSAQRRRIAALRASLPRVVLAFSSSQDVGTDLVTLGPVCWRPQSLLGGNGQQRTRCPAQGHGSPHHRWSWGSTLGPSSGVASSGQGPGVWAGGELRLGLRSALPFHRLGSAPLGPAQLTPAHTQEAPLGPECWALGGQDTQTLRPPLLSPLGGPGRWQQGPGCWDGCRLPLRTPREKQHHGHMPS